jgi:nitroreductase/NAD-dependent dihydropyrimidine dehydrogenase PreA subunit
MSLIKVDTEKCGRDGICIEVCPLNLLSLDPEGWPQMLPAEAAFCIGCGHCVAVCSNGALDNSKNPISKHTPIPADYSPEPAQSALFLRSRRSIRRYEDKPVSRDKIMKLLDIARFAPSAHNSQAISYLVVDGPGNLMRLSQIVVEWMRETVQRSPDLAKRFNMPVVIREEEKNGGRILRRAPHIIVAHAPADMAAAPVSTMLSLEYVELFAPALGLGTCWAGYAMACAQQFPAFSQFLRIPAHSKITGILMAGYPKYRYHRLPARNPLDVAWFETA